MSTIVNIAKIGVAAVIAGGALMSMGLPASAQDWRDNGYGHGYYHRYDSDHVYYHRDRDWQYRHGNAWRYRYNHSDYGNHPYANGWRWNRRSHVWFQIVL